MEHTKTPWVCGRPGYYGFCDIYGENDPKSKTICSVTTESDAAHIVRCVNAHDALVNALRNVAYFRDGQRCWCEPGRESDNHEGQCIAARAALALAEK